MDKCDSAQMTQQMNLERENIIGELRVYRENHPAVRWWKGICCACSSNSSVGKQKEHRHTVNMALATLAQLEL